MAGAQRTLRQFSSAIGSIRSTVLGLGAALTGVAGVAGLAAFTRANAQAVDQIGKLATRTGVSVEALQMLGRAADLAGTSLESVATALRVSQVAVVEAQRATSEQGIALRVLGLDAARLAEMGPERAFLAMADAVTGLPDEFTRAYAAQKLFGRSANELLPLLELGSAGLSKMQHALVATGQLLDATDVSGVERMNDAFTELYATVSAVARVIVAKLAPEVASGVEFATQALSRLGSADWAGNMASAFVTAFGTAANFVQGLNDALMLLELRYADVREFFAGGPDERKRWTAVRAELIASLEASAAGPSPAERLREWTDEILNAGNKLRARRAAGGDDGEFGAFAGVPTLDTFRQAFESQKKLTDGMADMEKAADRWRKAFATPVETLTEQFDELDTMLRTGVLTLDEWGRAADRAVSDATRQLGRHSAASLVPASLFGSAEASSIESRSRIAGSGDTTEKQQLAELREMRRLLAAQLAADEARRVAELIPLDVVMW